MISADFIFSLAISIPCCSIGLSVFLIPAVSVIVIGYPLISRFISIASRVVPAISETITAFLLARVFIRLDFPAFVAPAITILKPFFKRSFTLLPFLNF